MNTKIDEVFIWCKPMEANKGPVHGPVKLPSSLTSYSLHKNHYIGHRIFAYQSLRDSACLDSTQVHLLVYDRHASLVLVLL